MEKFEGIPEIFAKAYGGVRAAVYSIAGKSHLYHTRQLLVIGLLAKWVFAVWSSTGQIPGCEEAITILNTGKLCPVL